MICSYSKMYLFSVMKNIAALFDIAINIMGLPPEEFSLKFSKSDVAKGIEYGIPNMLCGKSAIEMLSDIYLKNFEDVEISMNRSAEYWAGWILALAQWELNISFEELLKNFSFSSIVDMYYPYHEADEYKMIEVIRKSIPKRESTLKKLRNKNNLSQNQLSVISGVNIRSIRSYEQGDNDICKASGDTLYMLSKALSCTMEELIK